MRDDKTMPWWSFIVILFGVAVLAGAWSFAIISLIKAIGL